MNLHSKFCYCYITWTCSCIIHLSEGPCYCTTCIYCTLRQLGGTLRLYYCTVLDYTPTWGGLAFILYCTLLYKTPTWGGLAIVVHCTIHLPEGGLAFILYCTILYKTPTWGGPAIVLVTGGGGRLSHFHQLSKLFYSILCPNMKIK